MEHNIEKRQAEFQKMKKVVNRKFKGSTLQKTPAGYSIISNGKNVVNPEWPDLQHAPTIYDAYQNAFMSEFWTRQLNKQTKKVVACIRNIVGDDSNMPKNEPTIDKERKSKIDTDEEVFDAVDYSVDKMEDWV